MSYSIGNSYENRYNRLMINHTDEETVMYNILVCDDDKEIVEAVSIYLEQRGFVVLPIKIDRKAADTIL